MLYTIIKPLCRQSCKRKTTQIGEDDTSHNNRVEEPPLVEHYGHFRDSILNESEPLLPTAAY